MSDPLVENLRKRGVSTPKSPISAHEMAADMHSMAKDRGELERIIKSHYRPASQEADELTKNNEIIRQMGISRSSKYGRKMESGRHLAAQEGGGQWMNDVSLALPRFYDPLEFWDVTGLPWNMADEGHRHKLHKWLRLYYATHYLVPLLIDIFARFPLVGMDVQLKKDPMIEEFYRDVFLNKLNYEEFLINLGREYWCARPDELIQTEDGPKQIKDIRPGDYVLTHRGRYREVLKTSVRQYKGKMRTLVPYDGIPTTFTHGHEIFVGQRVKGFFSKQLIDVWEPIENLDKGDYVYIPRHVGRYNDRGIWTILKEAYDIDYEGPVYNLEVKEDHSYVSSIAVHNCVGEAFAMGSFSETLGTWTSEELFNPENVVIKNFPMLGSSQLYITPPSYLSKLSREKAPAREYKILQTQYPELVPYLLKNEHIPVSDVIFKQVAAKATEWDDHGTPILLRCLRTLMHEEKLLASQDAICERLYSPFILAKLGITDLGDGQPPWVPEPADLEIVREDIDMALASDFRLMVHHFGIDIQNVFGREQMPRLGDDFDRIERRVTQAFGLNPSLLSAGASTQPYASSALNAEFLNQVLRGFQGYLKRHFLERAAIVAEAQEHYDFETKGRARIPLYENVIVYDEEGNERVETRPKLLLPELSMSVIQMNDQAQERQFMQALRAQGVPIPDEHLAVGIDYNTEDESRTYNDEVVKKTIIQQESKMKAYTILKAKNLPIPPDLKAEVEEVLSPSPSGSVTQAPQAPPGGPGPGGALPKVQPGGSPAIEPPKGSGGAGGQISQPPQGGPEGAMGEAGGLTAPPVSMERRQGLPRPASKIKDPPKEKYAKISGDETENEKDETQASSKAGSVSSAERSTVSKAKKTKRYKIIDESQKLSVDESKQEK